MSRNFDVATESAFWDGHKVEILRASFSDALRTTACGMWAINRTPACCDMAPNY